MTAVGARCSLTADELALWQELIGQTNYFAVVKAAMIAIFDVRPRVRLAAASTALMSRRQTKKIPRRGAFMNFNSALPRIGLHKKDTFLGPC